MKLVASYFTQAKLRAMDRSRGTAAAGCHLKRKHVRTVIAGSVTAQGLMASSKVSSRCPTTDGGDTARINHVGVEGLLARHAKAGGS